jgi:outer membrane beta-barrel protein
VALFVALLLSLPPLGASAQTAFEGLDLSEDSPSTNEGGGLGLDLDDEPPPSEPPSSSASSSSFAATPPPSPPPAEVQAIDGRLREIELTSDDRVKSVQPRSFIKQGRFELMPSVFVTLNDAYFPKYGPGLRLAYHPHESLGVALRANQYNVIPNDNVRLAKRQLRSQLPDVQPELSFALDVLWSAFYGKAKLFNAIRHFDLYVVGGLGAVLSETREQDGPLLSVNIGLGSRFSLNDFLALDLSFIETVYTDRPHNNGNKGVVQHILSINFGLSVFIPFSFEYKE